MRSPVQMRISAVAARANRARADLRRRIRRLGSADAALASLGRPARRDLEVWNERTSAGHDRYRRDHAPSAGDVAVVCVSNRPAFLEDVVANVARQATVRPMTVFVANDPAFDGTAVEAAFGDLPVRVLAPVEPWSIGTALNRAMSVTDARFVAKFDDDDLYGPGYLADALRAHRYSGAAVVGKHSYYADLLQLDRRVLRFPAHEFRYSGTLAGGTLVFDRERTGDLEFADLSLGEDRDFLRRCHARGWSTFSADRFNFVQRRGTHNTWRFDDASFLRGCIDVDPASPSHEVDR